MLLASIPSNLTPLPPALPRDIELVGHRREESAKPVGSGRGFEGGLVCLTTLKGFNGGSETLFLGG